MLLLFITCKLAFSQLAQKQNQKISNLTNGRLTKVT